MVFSNPAVSRRINEGFIPVALKAALVNNPPPGLEGELYAEIGRSKPAPQGICTANSAGKVLTWALSFDDDQSILKFLDHVSHRYHRFPDDVRPVAAERYVRFPSRKLADVADNGKRIHAPEHHATNDRCPAMPVLESGTLIGRIVGRACDDHGKPVAETIRQEHYMEARLHLPVRAQEQIAQAACRAGGKRFRVPEALARLLVSKAYLGQLDVNPSGGVPGSQNNSRLWRFWGRQVGSGDAHTVRIRLVGNSRVSGGQRIGKNASGDSRVWEHFVRLDWDGFIDISNQRVTRLVMIAKGDERLRWGNARFIMNTEPDARHLMAGHPIDLAGHVRYGLIANLCATDDEVHGAVVGGRRVTD